MNTTNNSIRLSRFETRSCERRIYVNGTTRDKIYFAPTGYLESAKLPGLVMNSDALRAQPNTSSLYTRRQKDLAAFNEAADAILSAFGQVSFDDLWEKI